MLAMLKKFLLDPDADDMFVMGRAGTGKTTDLKHAVAHCISNDIKYTVCAFTHKACGVLAEKLPEGASIQTLHKFLRKRPTVNTNATRVAQVEGNAVMGDSDQVSVVFVDEFGMVGEQDLMDVRALQDGEVPMKCVWIGDHKYQLPPVGDMFTLHPYGKYQVNLTKVYRQAEDNPLLATLNQLVSFMDGADPVPLIESEHFTRGKDIVKEASGRVEDSILLAFTNERVEALNRDIQGYAWPLENDLVFSPSTKQRYEYVVEMIPQDVRALDVHSGELKFGTKYKTLEHLIAMPDISYGMFELGEETYTYAFVFGHHRYNQLKNKLKKAAVQANQKYEKGDRKRAKAWRDFLTFNECVVCMDFAHAVTVHKSQGSTYDTVYLDTQDIDKARSFDYNLYLRLMYTGISRASNRVITN